MNTQVSIMPKHTILIVDDEVSIRDMLSIALDAAGYNVLQAENAQTAHSLVIDRHPDLILLDWMMPGTTGLELLRRLKRDESTEKTPVIMLTAKAQETNKISGLDAGADDYIAIPFSPRELISRVKAVLRRVGREDLKEPIIVGDLVFDPLGHRVSNGGDYINIGPTEYRLLQFFLTHQERVYSIIDEAEGTTISVADDGIGIDPMEIPRLTERFYRGDGSRNSQTGGSGLGLAIVKHAITQAGGTLTINSRLGQGAQFHVCLPTFEQ